MTPHLAITMGDPAGIGPEIIAKACAKLKDRIEAGRLKLLVIGHVPALHAAARFVGNAVEIPETTLDGEWPALACLAAAEPREAVAVGRVSAECGRFAYLAIERAVDLAKAGRVDALVTAPLNKEALNLAGYHYAGHTELLAALTGMSGSVMMLAHDKMHVSHLTTHIPLHDVPGRLTPKRLRYVIEVTHEALKNLGATRARIAVAALNPHAGEGGLFGRQDIDVSAPTIAQCVADGFDVVGPVPGDTVFVKLRAGQYDAVVAMYHDQGHIPVKLLGFQVDPATGAWNALSGVNITLGLPIIRTSVDHGTAFDIAGQGVASETSLIEAIDYAVRLSAGRERPGRAGSGQQ
ncbi:MAG: 4-hydroxythreonine-4-phosphate dehydrogenase PdxA [Proteobacteria bacterium]|nr:4-hydroxythreonine-4-phosphate dehydrogenase PdxA [Pseudomonadota bacterium]